MKDTNSGIISLFQQGIIFGGVHSDVTSLHKKYTFSIGIRFLTKEKQKVGIIVDNGTGILNVLADFGHYRFDKELVLQTHYHNDHLAGIESNSFLKDGVTFVGPVCFGKNSGACGPKGIIGACFDSVFSPRPKPKITLLQTDVSKRNLNSLEIDTPGLEKSITTIYLPHPGGCAGYRVKTPKGDVVIATDCELADSLDQERLARFIDGAKHIVLDMKYLTETQCVGHEGYGHNCSRLILETLSRTKYLKGSSIYLVHHPNEANLTSPKYKENLGIMAEALEKKELKKIQYATDGMTTSF